MAAQKIVSTFAISLLAMAAMTAHPAGVPGVHKKYRNAAQHSLILDKGSQLPKTPSRMSCSLTPTNRYPLADSLQVLQGNPRGGAFGQRYDDFRNAVIAISPEIRFLSTYFFQVSLGRFSPFLLKGRFQFRISLTARFDVFAAENISFAVCSDVRNTQINAEHICGFNQSLIGQVNGKQNKEFTFTKNEVGLAFIAMDSGFLVGPQDKRNFEPSFGGREANDFHTLNAQYATVINNGRTFLESHLNLPASPIGFYRLANGPYGELSRKSEPGADVSIAPLMHGGLGENLISEGELGGKIGRGIELVEGLQKYNPLICVGKNLDLRRELHGHMLGYLASLVKRKNAERDFA